MAHSGGWGGSEIATIADKSRRGCIRQCWKLLTEGRGVGKGWQSLKRRDGEELHMLRVFPSEYLYTQSIKLCLYNYYIPYCLHFLLSAECQLLTKGLVPDATKCQNRGGVSHTLILLIKLGGGVGHMLTITDKGGSPQIWLIKFLDSPYRLHIKSLL